MGAFLLLRTNEHLQNLKQITVTLEGRRDFRGGDHHDCRLGHRIDTTGPHELFHADSGRTLAFQAKGWVTGRACREVNVLRRICPTAVDLVLGSDRTVSGKA